MEGLDSQSLREEQLQKQSQGQFKGLSSSDKANSGSNGSNESKDIQRDGISVKQERALEKINVKSEGSNSSGGGSVSNSNSQGNNHKSDPNKKPQHQQQQQQQIYWLREGIRVKIISKSVGGQRAYLQKGTVLDVYARGRAAVRLDDNSVLDEVNERHVETIVPSVGAECIVLLGEYRGQYAVLMERRRDEQRVVVQLSEDLDMVELDMDSIAATSK